MSLLLDLILVLIAVIAIYRGIKRGFINSVMSLLSVVISLIAVVTFTSPVSDYLYENLFHEVVASPVEEELLTINRNYTKDGEEGRFETVSDLIGEYPEPLKNIVDRFKLKIDEIKSTDNGSTYEGGIKNLSKTIVKSCSRVLSDVVAALIIFAASMLVLSLVTLIIDRLFSLPVLRTFNTVLGLLFGIGTAIALVWFASSTAVKLMEPLSSLRGDIFNESVLDNSVIVSFLRENGLIN